MYGANERFIKGMYFYLCVLCDLCGESFFLDEVTP